MLRYELKNAEQTLQVKETLLFFLYKSPGPPNRLPHAQTQEEKTRTKLYNSQLHLPQHPCRQYSRANPAKYHQKYRV